MTRRTIGLFFSVFSVLMIFHASVRGQEISDEANKLRLAQSLERSGQYEKAAKLYEDLHTKHPSNFVFFDGLHRMYVQLKEYGKVIAMVHERLGRYPNDLNLLGTLGEDYLKAGKETEALAAWERALATDERNQNVYRYISNILVQNRLFSKNVEVLLRGRKSTGNPNLFAADLGYGYTILGNYAEATKEYVRALRENPGILSFIETRMALYTGKPDGLRVAVGAVQEEVREDRKNIVLQRLLAWLHLEGKQFENALSVYRLIDQLGSAGGQELLAFAERAFKEKAFEVSGKAYKELIERYPKTPIAPVAKFGYTRVIEELSAKSDTLASSDKADRHPADEQHPATEAQPTYGGAIAYYTEIDRDYPQSDFALQALYRISLIKFDRFFDVDGALQTLERIEKRFPSTRIMPSVGLKAGEILVAKGELQKAAERFSKVRENPLAGTDDKDKAMFALAELEYFQGSFDSALVKLKGLLGNLSADIANDVLILQEFIKEHRTGNPLGLKEYARAELLQRQRKLSEAKVLLEQLIASSTKSPIVDDALLKVGQLETKIGDVRRALSTYEKLILEHPESILRDKAQLSIGEIYEYYLKDSQKAIVAYQTLLENYPNSLFLDEARKRIRRLRGDVL